MAGIADAEDTDNLRRHGPGNAVLHLIAMAGEAGVELGLDDFTRIGARVPVLADVKQRQTGRAG